MQETMTHNTQLTQQSWGFTSVMQYDVSNVFIDVGLDYQQSQPYQQPEQENSDEEEEEENPDEGEQDSDEED